MPLGSETANQLIKDAVWLVVAGDGPLLVLGV